MNTNKITLFLLLITIGALLLSSCKTAEEISEPEPEPVVTEEPVEDNTDYSDQQPQEEEEVDNPTHNKRIQAYQQRRCCLS